jgi:hypothetical protein
LMASGLYTPAIGMAGFCFCFPFGAAFAAIQFASPKFPQIQGCRYR